MLTLKKLRASTGGASAVSEYLASEYYQAEPGSEGHSVSRWTGRLAEKLGLEGEVNANDLKALLGGFAPDGLRPLVKNAGSNRRRMGEDLCFSADKSISLAFAVASPEEQKRIIADTQEAAKVAIEYLRTQMVGYDGQPVEGLAVAQFEHFSNRNGEVDLHTHCVVMNAVDTGRRTQGYDPAEIYRQKKTAGALYRAELTHRLIERGYAFHQYIEKDSNGYAKDDIFYKVGNIDRPTELAFSSRRTEILAKAEEKGWSMAKATLETRHGKEANFQQTIQSTRQTLDSMGLKLTTPELEGQSKLPTIGDDEILRRCHRQESAFTMADAIREVARTRGGTLDAKGCIKEASEMLERTHILTLDRGRFASREQAGIEQDIRNSAVSRKHDKSVRLDPDTVAKAISESEKSKGFTFSQEQRQAVEFVACGSGGTACLVGYAGTGKTTTADAYIRAFEADGREVIGCSTAWKAAKKLEKETGMKSLSIASLSSNLDNGKLKLSAKSVLVVDEAGMVGARNIHKLQQAVDQAGGKLILLGDPKQLQPIEAGAGFALAMGSGTAEQTEIRRQRDPEHRKIAEAFYSKANGQKLVEMMAETGAIHLASDTEKAKAKLVADFLADPEQDKHIIAATNAEVSALNKDIRTGLKTLGRLDAQTERTVIARGEKEGETLAIGLCEGDAIRFTDRSRQGFENGTTAKVLAVKNGRLAVELDGGKRLELDTSQPLPITYDYAQTVHKSQGQTYKNCYWLTNGETTRELGLVAYTRHSEQMGVYTTTEGRKELTQSLNDFEGKANVMDYARDRVNNWRQALAEKLDGWKKSLTHDHGKSRTLTELLHPQQERDRGMELGM